MATNEIEVSCRRCGATSLPVQRIAVARGHNVSDGLIAFRCPSCANEAMQAVANDDAVRLLLLGAAPMPGPQPLELTESHAGASVSWDEVLDAHEAMDGHCCPQDELAG